MFSVNIQELGVQRQHQSLQYKNLMMQTSEIKINPAYTYTFSSGLVCPQNMQVLVSILMSVW